MFILSKLVNETHFSTDTSKKLIVNNCNFQHSTHLFVNIKNS